MNTVTEKRPDRSEVPAMQGDLYNTPYGECILAQIDGQSNYNLIGLRDGTRVFGSGYPLEDIRKMVVKRGYTKYPTGSEILVKVYS